MLFLFFAAANLSFETVDDTGAPTYWQSKSSSYQFTTDDRIASEGTRSLRIRSIGEGPHQLGANWQELPELAGKRVRVSAHIKRENISDYGAVYLRADVNKQLAVLETMSSQALGGTADWTEASFTVSIPLDADPVFLGATLYGTGTLWVDDIRIEVLERKSVLPVLIAAALLGLAIFAFTWRRSLLQAGAIAIAAGGVTVALFAPVETFELVLVHLIGNSASANTTLAQRIIGASGALLCAFALLRLTSLEQGTNEVSKLKLVLVALPFCAMIARNVFFLMGTSIESERYFPITIVLCASAVLFLGAPRRSESNAILTALIAGAAYGCVSSLWHCCPPFWKHVVDASNVLWLGGLCLGLSATGRFGASLRQPYGELASGLLFAMFYPWHSPLWFLQCVAGGAFATWLNRSFQSAWTPAVFLGTSYLTHMSLPFLGWSGAAIAVSLAALAAASTRVLRFP